jgi:hypothetical protein
MKQLDSFIKQKSLTRKTHEKLNTRSSLNCVRAHGSFDIQVKAEIHESSFILAESFRSKVADFK